MTPWDSLSPLPFETAVLLALVLLLAVLLLGAGLLTFSFARRQIVRQPNSVVLLQQELSSLRAELADHMRHQSARLEHAHQTMGQRLDHASASVSQVRQQLGVLEQATQRVLEVGQSVAGIENLLRAPKLRGVLGEVLLAELLRQVLPPALFELQYRLASGSTVDAMIHLGDALLPIDAKFPLENLRRAEAAEPSERERFDRLFHRDFRRHVEAIASKYIVPDEGTLSMAFLYVPAENVYQQAVLGDPELSEYAVSRRVIPMGPLGLHAFLQCALLGTRSLAVPAAAREILAGLEQIALELGRMGEDLSKLGRHLGLARSSLEQIERRNAGLTQTVDRARSSLDTTETVRPTPQGVSSLPDG